MDGMDMSLIRLKMAEESSTNPSLIDKSFSEIMWAGANNPLYHIKPLDGQQAEKDVQDELHYIEVIAPNKQPIAHYYNMKPFTDVSISTSKEDVLVLFTDGFADQMGGKKDKKLMSKNFRKMLLANKHKTMDELKKSLSQNFTQWKGEGDQVDDVCVIGIRV